jgi:hypothetical protein
MDDWFVKRRAAVSKSKDCLYEIDEGTLDSRELDVQAGFRKQAGARFQ